MAQYDYQDMPNRQQKPYFLRYILIFIFLAVVVLIIFAFKAISGSLGNKVGRPIHEGEVQGVKIQASINIDKFLDTEYENKPTYQLVGWIFPNNLTRPLADYQRELVLIDAASMGYYFEVIDQKRPDVTKYYTKVGANLDASGFIVNIGKKALRQGLYQVAFSFTLPGESQPMVFYTNYFLEQTAGSLQLVK